MNTCHQFAIKTRLFTVLTRQKSRGEARLQMYPRVGLCSEVPNNADADKKIALVTIARRYIQLRQSRPEVPNFPA